VLTLKLSGVDLHLEAITTYLHHDRPALQLHVAVTECVLCCFLESTLSLRKRTSSQKTTLAVGGDLTRLGHWDRDRRAAWICIGSR